jgi:hypothetical protein
VRRERAVEQGDAHLVEPERAVERVAAHRLDRRRPADEDAGLHAAEQLVAAAADDVDPRREARRHLRLAGERARAGPRRRGGRVDEARAVVLDHRHAEPPA